MAVSFNVLPTSAIGNHDHNEFSTKPQSLQLITQTASFDKKQCTKCLAELPDSGFYSKGNRLDAECKKCRRARRRTTYVSQTSRASFAKVKSAIDLAVGWELERIRALKRETQQIIHRAGSENRFPAQQKEIAYATGS